jgi:hypothetical protein
MMMTINNTLARPVGKNCAADSGGHAAPATTPIAPRPSVELEKLVPDSVSQSVEEASVTPPGKNPTGTTLTLDLGTHTGWAIIRNGELVRSGTFHLATDDELELQRQEGRERTLDVRFGRLYEFITKHIGEGINRIVFEDVEFASTRMQSQLWASLRSSIWAAALPRPDIQIFGLPVATLKRFATANGGAQKLEMAQALARHRPDSYISAPDGSLLKADGESADDNEIDAIWLAHYAEAVDAGERSFLGVYQRKQLAKAERSKRKAERRQKSKARRTAERAIAKSKQRAIKEAIRSMGKCCGVFRNQIRRKAVCPGCGSAILIPMFAPKPRTAPLESR